MNLPEVSTGSAAAVTVDPIRPGRNGWVPIRALTPRHAQHILAHLLRLTAEDRYLRFGYLLSDEQITRYVDTLDFARDALFGIFNRKLELIGWAHLAFMPEESPAMAEFGVSVLGHVRGRRLGARLFEHAMLLARNRGVDTLIIHSLSENVAMLRLARRAGAEIERHGAESEARLKLPRDSLASKVEEMMGAQAAEVDYQLKAQNHHMDQWLKTVRSR